ncbi:MFS transporter [Pseudomonas marincola]|uniref:MFS transporter n=1 Tax=Pseudomonas marincola TaxID=437900 RepID=UPI0008E011DA|nr:MFS transporter [Pseudomonas marincola]SFT92810.1 hypothetical protein SAMN05216264_106185 [Pseudomonas marincola]
MDALLILAGLLLILAGLAWLVIRAFSTSLLWGWASLLPPLTLLFVLLKWRAARQPIGLGALGFIPLIVGLAMLGHQDPQRINEILSLKWLQSEQQGPSELSIKLHGTLNGQPFSPQQGELIGGVLTLREGHDFYARRELIIRLPESMRNATRIDVLPTDTGPLPEIELNWLLPEQDLPEARLLRNGYTLHADLKPLAPNKFEGELHLVLPPGYKTSLDGHVELYRNGLRYVDGRVDRQFDSNDTVAYVLNDYLQRRFATADVQLDPLPVVSFSQNTLALNASATINGVARQLPVTLRKFPMRGWAVSDDRYPALAQPEATAPEPASTQPLPAALQSSADAPRIDRRENFSLKGLLRSPDRYRNLNLRVTNLQGNTAKGRFIGIDGEGNLQLKRRLNGAGEATFTFSPTDIAEIVLLEP